jgi:hypothetical protein
MLRNAASAIRDAVSASGTKPFAGDLLSVAKALVTPSVCC